METMLIFVRIPIIVIAVVMLRFWLNCSLILKTSSCHDAGGAQFAGVGTAPRTTDPLND